ncbi:PEP-CTERM sorting domain-containing protein [Aquisphaera insulae]|uniref:PEP-CTERM sorting domain-containing protein n=1 Tax=Aquisphaera insulae TaxID=2712864 RepID=UPI0013EA245F|nr:PEP-CTERM sorting domain-containing protein [Aquisphaera insulae]
MTYVTRLIAASTLFAITFGGWAHAGYVVNIVESGGNVVATGSGTINTTDLSITVNGGNSWDPVIGPSEGFALLGAPRSRGDGYVGDGNFQGIDGPSSFGSGSVRVDADSGTGDDIGIAGGPSPSLYVALDLDFGSELHSSATWVGQTFASLGLTPGTYTWTWGTGANADFFTVNIGAASVPEPSSLLLAVGGLGTVGLAARARRHATVPRAG